MRWLALNLVVGLVLGACVRSSSVSCGDILCPEGTTCAQVPPLGTYCANQDELAACAGLADGASCALAGGMATCHGGVCFPNQCGNLLVDQGEVCDDGNETGADGCAADCRSNEVCGNAVVDPIKGEQCDLGDAVAHDGCSSACQIEHTRWDKLPTVPARESSVLTYDSDRHRVVMFGGFAGFAINSPIGDTVEWNGQRWTPARVTLSPPAPPGNTRDLFAFDAGRHEEVLLAGEQTWTRDLDGWKLRATDHVPQSPSALAYDAARGRLILLAGAPGSPASLWAWDGGDWSELESPPATLTAKLRPAMEFDPKRNVMVLFGGSGTDELWEYDGTQWTQRTKSGAWPAPRQAAGIAWDAVNQQIMVVGGYRGVSPQADVWLWNGTTWTSSSPIIPGLLAEPHFERHSMTADLGRRVVVVVDIDGTVYEWSGSTWSTKTVTMGDEPTPRYDAAAASDPLYRETVVFGGNDINITNLNDTWMWNGAWTQMPSPITARTGARMVYDPLRGEIVLFGGYSQGTYFNETWVWQHVSGGPTGQWIQRMPALPPPGRAWHTMAWDGVRGRVITMDADMWSWDGTTWMQDSPAITPPPQNEYAAIAWDPVHRQVVMFGGYNQSVGIVDETWVWDGAIWQQATSTDHPTARMQAALAWDPARAHLVLVGGTGTAGAFDDLWEWDGAKWLPQVTPAGGPSVIDHALVTAPDGSGVIAIGGRDLSIDQLSSSYRLRWNDDTAREEECTANDTDGDGLAGCADPDCWPVCAPLCQPGVTPCPAGPHCGDGTCDVVRETCDACPSDCGPCPP